MLPLETQILIRIVYAVLLIGLILFILPFSRPYFTTERYRGCIDSGRLKDLFFSPAGHYVLTAVWLTALVMLALGRFVLIASAVNLTICYVHFIRLRWKSIFRGMGAPGFISFWLACFVFLVEYATAFGDPGGRLRDLVVLAFRVDFGIMMMDSAINKIGHGYPRNLGMNFGMANPAWSYWPKLFKPLPMNHPLFTFMNHSAWFFQILGGLCLLIPPVQWMGALIIVLSFLLVKCIIRLGVLCDKLMLIPVIYTKSGGWMEQLLTRFYTVDPGILGAHGPVPVVNEILTAVLWAYIILLPLAKLGMYTNFYFKKTLPGLLQTALEKFTAAFGIILWRVFTIDLINFFLLAYFEDPKTGERILHTRFGHWKWNQTNRFLWVGESIMSLIVFNTERYFQEPGLFEKRVIRYARTMPCPEGWNVVFEYVVLSPTPHGFDYLPAREFRVDLKKETVEQRILDEKAVQVKQRFTSPVRATARPGSYAPVKP